MDGVLNFLKPPGMTSHDAVAFVRRIASQKRVGHTGTLDPAAAGVLPICLGQATRLVEYLQAGRKIYSAEITFGIETDSHDAMGNITRQADASSLSFDDVSRVLAGFRGEISQTPPLFSAIKKDGQKLYDLARSGADEEEMNLAPRVVQIYSLQARGFTPASTRASQPRVFLDVECGGGTYIRSLARDIGRALGCYATMSFLVRTQNGSFAINDAQTPQQCESGLRGALLSLPDALRNCADIAFTSDEAAQNLAQGRVFPVEISGDDDARVLVMNEAETIAALAHFGRDENNATRFLRPHKVFDLGADAA